MSLVAVSSPKGSPGATTLAYALAVAWPATAEGARLLVEADPDGGVLAARFGLGLSVSLADVASDGRRGISEAVLDRASLVLAADDLRVVVCPASAEESVTVLHRTAEALAMYLSTAPGTAVVDVGRLSPGSVAMPLARHALVTVLVTAPDLAMAAVLRHRVDSLRAQGCEPVLVTVGSAPESPRELAGVVGVPWIGTVAIDAKAARAAGRGSLASRALRRSMWWRSVREVAGELDRLASDRMAIDAGQHAAPGTTCPAGSRRRLDQPT